MGFFSEDKVVAITWEPIKSNLGFQGTPKYTTRAKIEGGWLVSVTNSDGIGVTFVPDPDHKWILERV